MKNRETSCKLLGTTQEEMAMLLKVNRSQWSMFEAGKRDLPLASLQFLSEILAYMQSPETKATKSKANLAKEKAENKQTLEALVKENQYQQLRMARKIAVIEKKQEASVKALQLATYLIKLTDKNREPDSKLLENIAIRANKTIAQNGLPILLSFQMKQAVVQQEEVVLTAALKGLD